MLLPFKLTAQELARIDARICEFKQLYLQDSSAWFSELCFCILTANAQAKKAIAIQEKLGSTGFLQKSQEEIAGIIRAHGHRFHNTKARYISNARNFGNIKERLSGLTAYQAREFIVKNIKGLGYKEASHFLRNVGYTDVAIIDRHIVKFLVNYNFITKQPKVITKKIYLELENLLAQFNIAQNKLDLMIWYHMTGEVLK